MSTSPPLSVLLPVRDAAAWLGAALESLRIQTFADFEVLLQDDGSTDDSPQIVRRFAASDARFRVEHGEAQGIVHALNAAATRARGELLVRMDADDVAEPTRLECLVDAARERPDVAFFGSRVTPLTDGGELTEGMRAYHDWLDGVCEHDQIVAARFVECPLPHPTWAMRAPLFRALRGYRNGPFPEDYDFFLRAVDLGVRFHKLPERLLLWREHRARASRSDESYSLAAFFGLKARFLVAWLQGRGDDVVVVGTGKAARRWARRLEGASVAVRACLPVSGIETLRHGRPSVALVAVGRDERKAALRALEAQGFEDGKTAVCLQ